MTVEAAIRGIIGRMRRIAVVGYSDDPEKYSHRVAAYLASAGFAIVPVNPRLAGQIHLGTTAVAAVGEIAPPVDVAVIFRRPEQSPDAVREAIGAKIRAVWLPEGVVSAEAEELASAAGIDFVMDRCIMKEHQRASGGPAA